jgi:hypothetical protein
MKLGHRKKFPYAIKEAKDQIAERKAKQKRERTEEEVLAQELATIERERTLARARRTRDLEDQEDRNEYDAMPDAVQGKTNVDNSSPPYLQLPAGKSYHAFFSHKKIHSVHKNASEALARAVKDWLEDRGIKGFFDVSLQFLLEISFT